MKLPSLKYKMPDVFSDSDKDGYPNIIDCKPYDPTKQGFISWVMAKAQGKTHDEVEVERYQQRAERAEDKAETRQTISQYQSRITAARPKNFIERAVEKRQEWRANAPIRRKAQIKQLGQEIEIQNKKNKLELGKMKLQKERISIRKMEQKASPNMFGSPFSAPGSKQSRKQMAMPSFSPWTPAPTLANLQKLNKPQNTSKPKKKGKKKLYKLVAV